MGKQTLLQQPLYTANQITETLQGYIIYFGKKREKNLIRLALKQNLWGNLNQISLLNPLKGDQGEWIRLWVRD